jgi:hypothetical protein
MNRVNWDTRIIQAVAASGYGSLAITDDDDSSVIAWGLFDGQALVDPTRIRVADDNEIISAIAAGGYHALLLSESGRVWSFGKNGDGQLGDGSHNASLS